MQLDLNQLLPKSELVGIDLVEQLEQGLILREKAFRSWISNTNWTTYDGKAVHLFCSTEAVIPNWAFLLVSVELNKLGIPHVVGTRHDLVRELVIRTFNSMDFQAYQDSKIMIKGCTDFSDTPFAMSELVKRLQPFASSIMYGEPCSAVPVFKRR